MSKSNSNFQDPHPHTGALRAQLGSLLHGHQRAEFHARIVIHQLSSVPLLGGSFGVKWKFRGVIPPKGKEKEKSKEWDRYVKHKKNESNKDKKRKLSQKRTLKEASLQSASTSTTTATTSDGELSLGSGAIPLTASPTHSTFSLQSTSSSSGHTGSVSSRAPSQQNSLAVSEATSPNLPSAPLPGDGASNPPPPPPIHYHSHDRGLTPFLPLIHHSTTFDDHTIDVLLAMNVEPPSTSSPSTPGKLVSSPFKLVVLQMEEKDENAPSNGNPRLGAVYLDLAEYADPKLGKVTRKYLLMESKTNAMLQITIHLTPRLVPPGGFTCPPLNKCFIQCSLSSLLQPGAISGPGRPQTPISLGHTHLYRTSNASSASSSRTNLRRTVPSLTKTTPANTEAIIDAIFNPFPSSSRVQTPFTYKVEPGLMRPPPTPLGSTARTADSWASTADSVPRSSLSIEVKPPTPSMFSVNITPASTPSLNSSTPKPDPHQVPLPPTPGAGLDPTSPIKPGLAQAQTTMTSPSQARPKHVRQQSVGGSKEKHWWSRVGPSRPDTPVS